MESRPRAASTVDPREQGAPPTTISGRAWWKGPVFGAVSPAVLSESTSRSTAVDLPLSGGGENKGGQLEQRDGVDGTRDASEEIKNMGTRRDETLGLENQHPLPASSSMLPTVPEYLVPQTHLELGQTACATYSYADPYFAGIVAPYGTQALVHPQMLGMPHARMPLPLEITEEPIYVNAKQYHGILRRRQSRAKAELEKKVTKVRKPYLHESRHLHAMRRARGCGGRFLNTKKIDGSVTKTDMAKYVICGVSLPLQTASSSGSEALASDFSGNQDTSCTMQGDASINGKDNYQHHSIFQSSSLHSEASKIVEEADCLGQQPNGILVNQPSKRAVATQ